MPAHVLTALDLVADPENALAWRCWCGYGDWLANSSAMANLRAYADEHDKGLAEALREVQDSALAANEGDADRVVGAKRVADAREAGLALIESAAGLEGKALLDKLAELVTGQEGATAPGIVSTLCLGEQDNSAAAMAKRFRNRLLAPRIDAASAVQAVPYDQVAGLSPKVLIISGFVNGFIPCREYFDGAEMPLDKQEKEHAKDARRVYAHGRKGKRAAGDFPLHHHQPGNRRRHEAAHRPHPPARRQAHGAPSSPATSSSSWHKKVGREPSR